MLSIQDEVLPISILTGQEREAARDAGVEVQGGRRAKDGDRADGDEADAVLLREPGRRLLQEHLGHRVSLRANASMAAPSRAHTISRLRIRLQDMKRRRDKAACTR